MKTSHQIFIFELLTGVKTLSELSMILNSAPQIMETFREFTPEIKEKILKSTELFNYFKFNNKTVFINFIHHLINEKFFGNEGPLYDYGQGIPSSPFRDKFLREEYSTRGDDEIVSYYDFSEPTNRPYIKEKNDYKAKLPEILPSDRPLNYKDLRNFQQNYSKDDLRKIYNYIYPASISENPDNFSLTRLYDMELTEELKNLIPSLSQKSADTLMDYLSYFNLGIDYNQRVFERYNDLNCRGSEQVIADYFFDKPWVKVDVKKFPTALSLAIQLDKFLYKSINHMRNKDLTQFTIDAIKKLNGEDAILYKRISLILLSGAEIDMSRILTYCFTDLINSLDIVKNFCKLAGLYCELLRVKFDVPLYALKNTTIPELFLASLVPKKNPHLKEGTWIFWIL